MTGLSALDRIKDDIDALVLGVSTTEDIDRLEQTATGWKKTKAKHTVRHPALIDQLSTAVQSSTLGLDDNFRPSFGSKPSARLDALAALERIDNQSKEWAQTLHSRVRVTLKDRLRGLVGGATSLPSYQHDLAHAVRSWAVMAKVVTGLEEPPFTPDVACPNVDCERRGSLRVRLDDKVAFCMECDEYWDQLRIGQFAEYVAWASEHLHGPRHWLIDAEGYPIECTECLATRDAMGERASMRRQIAATRQTGRAS